MEIIGITTCEDNAAKTNGKTQRLALQKQQSLRPLFLQSLPAHATRKEGRTKRNGLDQSYRRIRIKRTKRPRRNRALSEKRTKTRNQSHKVREKTSHGSLTWHKQYA